MPLEIPEITVNTAWIDFSVKLGFMWVILGKGLQRFKHTGTLYTFFKHSNHALLKKTPPLDFPQTCEYILEIKSI